MRAAGLGGCGIRHVLGLRPWCQRATRAATTVRDSTHRAATRAPPPGEGARNGARAPYRDGIGIKGAGTIMARTNHRFFGTAAVMHVLAGTAVAAPTDVVWVDNESFALTGCAGSDSLPGDPQQLMSALRERGLADAGQVRLNAKSDAAVTLTPISASWRCDGAPSSVVFRMSSVDRASGQATTSHIVSSLPAMDTVPAARLA